MEIPNYLTQAKDLLKSVAHSTACRIVPLAMAASMAANAAVILTYTTGGLTVLTGSEAAGGTSFGGTPINGGAGLKLFGTATILSEDLGGFHATNAIMRWEGTGSGTFDSGFLPISWDFTIDRPGASWSLDAFINGGGPFNVSSGSGNLADEGKGSGFLADQGSGGINVTRGGPLTSWAIELSINDSDEVPFSDTINVPASSIDLNDINAIPEPSTLMLLGGGGVLLLVSRWRRG